MPTTPLLTRPRFHFTAHAGWLNDPLGLTWHDGRYDLFFQHIPDSTVWSPDCHWGHAASRDLITWEEKEPALSPGDGDDGVWSGSAAIAPDGTGILFYTSVSAPDIGIGRIRVARPSDHAWTSWVKGPVVAEVPTEVSVTAYRDPFVFRNGVDWHMLVGAGLDGDTAAALLYTSSDLRSWRYKGVAAQRPSRDTAQVWTGSLWECPQLFEVDGQHVLVTSVWEDDVLHYVAYGVGSYSDGRFRARTWKQLSFGRSYYAPSFFRDNAGRPCLIFWLRNVGDASWTGALSVPHTLSLDGDTLVARPHSNLDAYRGSWRVATEETIDSTAAEIRWSPRVGGSLTLTSGETGVLTMVRTPNGLRISSGSAAARDSAPGMPRDGGEVRVLIDGPVLEVSTPKGIFATHLPTSEPLHVRGDSAFSAATLARG